MLEPFELSSVEETLYLALIDAPSLTAAELALLADATTDGAAPILARLEATGLVTRLPGTPHRYCAIEPGIGLATLIATQEQRAQRAEEQAQHARATARQLAERFRLRGARHPLDLIEVVVGTPAVMHRIEQLHRMARTELRGIDMPPYVMSDNDAEFEILDKGVASRWLYDQDVLDIPGKLDQINRFWRAGEQGRIITGAPFKLVLADNRQAMIALTDESSGTASALMVGPSVLLDGLSRVFESLWRFAVPLRPTDPDPGADLPSADEGQLLGLLAAGMTDKIIARRTGIGMRTVQKRVQQLMDRLGAGTRFQAGAQAKARGWL
jgi:DNA-binding CsgD family transcriptional regulator